MYTASKQPKTENVICFVKIGFVFKRFVTRLALPSFARTGHYFWRAKVTKTPSLETFAGRACTVASSYILQSFRGDISFNKAKCNAKVNSQKMWLVPIPHTEY